MQALEILFQPAATLLGLKPEVTKALARLGINSLRDLLFHKPNFFQASNLEPDLSKLHGDELIQATVTIKDVVVPQRKGPIKVWAGNETGEISLIFFNKIPPFLFAKLRVGNKHIISGKVQRFDNYFQIAHPEFIFDRQIQFEPQQEKAKLKCEPIYPLTYAITNKQLYSYIQRGLQLLEERIIPAIELAEFKQYCIELFEDLRILHLYKTYNLLPEKVERAWQQARASLAKKELFANQIFLAKVRRQKNTKNGRSILPALELKNQILQQLGFALTPAQIEVVREIEIDQRTPMQMTRLLQGDVGSGKTLVALLTMLNVAKTGAQSILMAPTDLLANQHYHFFTQALIGIDIKIALLTGKTTSKERRIIMAQLESGEIKLLLGTHALFQEKVIFHDLAYIVIDEQHRFGVEQRLKLINKASHPDVLVMTATPIPRSLTLTMFGDMAISKLAGKPANRLPIITTATPLSKIHDIIQAISKKIDLRDHHNDAQAAEDIKLYTEDSLVDGRKTSGELAERIVIREHKRDPKFDTPAAELSKVYWICPLIDRNEELSIEGVKDTNFMISDVITRFLSLQELYPGKVAVMHGKLPATQKDLVMQQFKHGEIDILVSTTVIEVGIDVPDATLIIIENAEKFGLAQLHQLRGRVGRGSKQSYCILLYNNKRLSKVAAQRLEVMRASNDGFYIAEQDLVLRGSGDILGTKQSGEPVFFYADLVIDRGLLDQAESEAEQLPFSPFSEFQIKLFGRDKDEVIGSG